MTTAKTIGRRELLRGGGVAALTVAGATVIPLVAKAEPVSEGEAMRLWQQFMAAETTFGNVLEDSPEGKQAIDAALDDSFEARLAIATLPVTGPMAIAVKLATVATKERRDYMKQRADDDRDLDLLDNCCLISIYQNAVAECGYDPLAHFWKDYDTEAA